MKKKNKRNRILALVLCMLLIVSQGTFIFAGETVASPEVFQEVSTEPTVTEAPAAPVAEAAPVATQEPTADPMPATTEAPTPEPTVQAATPEPTAEAAAPEPTAEPESGAVTDSAQGAASEVTVENTTSTDSAGAVTDPAQGAANTAENTEETAEGTLESEETTSEGEEESEILSEETYTQVLNYEDEDVQIFVEAKTADAIPENASLKVVPILPDDEETEEQYKSVEEELLKKAEDEEYEIAGFLAYDITFVDVDGNEIEPNGDVKVSMEYKKAVIPDAINTDEIAVENLNVTVMHLEENELGEVKEVVDMVADDHIEAEVKTTERIEVEKAEFVTDGFSAFTITWTNSNASLKANIFYGYINNNGNFIEIQKENIVGIPEPSISITNESKIIDLHDYKYSIAGYHFKEIRLDSANYDGKQARYLQCNEHKQVYYATEKSDDTYLLNGMFWANMTSSGVEKNIYFIYQQHVATSGLTTIQTVDHELDGIVMKMTNYSNEGFGKENFMNLGGRWKNDGSITQGLLLNTLGTDGYPVIDRNKQSLMNAFDTNGTITVNNLFSKAIYDATGYYEYSSFENYAYLNQETRRFTVYEQIGAPKNNLTSDIDRCLYQRGNFFPYNDIKTGNLLGDTQRNRYDEDGKLLSESDYRYNEPLYEVENPDYYFGMYLEAKFIQPKDGKVKWNNKTSPMIYEFNGDDDLWVYIDGVLVLDLGGIHVAHKGSINFSTGEIQWDNQRSTLKKAYQDAGKFPDGNRWNKDMADQYFKKDTFADYTDHTFKMFYMERGAGASDLHVRFNFHNPLIVEKEITNDEKGAHNDEEFSFQIYGENGNSLLSQGTSYTHVGANGTETSRTIGNDEVFKLKHGEKAIFSHLDSRTPFYVKEIDIDTNKYDKVDIVVNRKQGNIKQYNIKEESIADGIVSTDQLKIGKDYRVLFRNQCAAKHLVIKKTLKGQAADDSSASETFSMQVTIDGNLYNGTYKVGADYEDALNSETEKNASDGVIQVQANQVAVIMGSGTGIPSGTSFQVQEIKLAEKYGQPTYTVEGADPAETGNESDSSSASGIISITGNAIVTVENRLKEKLTVKKEWKSQITNISENIYVGLYRKNETSTGETSTGETLLLNADNEYKGDFIGYSTSNYTVKELRPSKDEEKKEFTIEGIGYIGINDGDVVVINNGNYKVTYGLSDKDGAITITITNTQLAKITIEKVSKSDNSLKLSGAEFKLQKYDDAANKYVDINRTGTTETNGVLIFDELEIGKYQIIETKAPAGYVLLGTPVQIELPITDDGVIRYEITQIIENEVLYDLPSTGSFGIYWYIIGGVLLMFAATLILYKNRRKEVLARYK